MGLQFRLVRTSDGERWTFPKGQRESRETLAQTAAREAAEEAGVTGVVNEKRLTDYRHAPGHGPGGEDDVVAAFLLAVQSVGPMAERGRDPSWFDPTMTREKLAEGRDELHARELQRVLDAALAEL
jgi:8-oxo-dGTP pyrophosphatase MutT (NUDIX family)